MAKGWYSFVLNHRDTEINEKAIILHGICDEDEYFDQNQPSPSNNNWIAWLQKHLMFNGFDCQTPEVSHTYKGIYEDWKNTFERMEIDEDTILIGHSAGCGFFLNGYPITVLMLIIFIWLHLGLIHLMNIHKQAF